ncbi:hypothetical protein [Roseovarius indicus]|uniref:hypothetical protein n=1 Tax=Roseovarius indicus TaxID=540747 RepID=UPI0032EF470B
MPGIEKLITLMRRKRLSFDDFWRWPNLGRRARQLSFFSKHIHGLTILAEVAATRKVRNKIWVSIDPISAFSAVAVPSIVPKYGNNDLWDAGRLCPPFATFPPELRHLSDKNDFIQIRPISSFILA